jgi:hypothetical protein
MSNAPSKSPPPGGHNILTFGPVPSTRQIRTKSAFNIYTFGHARLNLYSVRQPDDEEHLLSPEQLLTLSYHPANPGKPDGATDHPGSIR